LPIEISSTAVYDRRDRGEYGIAPISAGDIAISTAHWCCWRCPAAVAFFGPLERKAMTTTTLYQQALWSNS
jgi:hypothetical protein